MGPNKRGFMEHILFAPFEQIGIHQHFCFLSFSLLQLNLSGSLNLVSSNCVFVIHHETIKKGLTLFKPVYLSESKCWVGMFDF